MSNQAHSERTHDRTLEESFPASDPPSHSGVTGAERPDKPSSHDDTQEKPMGTPTSDRHATETAHHQEDGSKRSPKP
jgi:hypothetical protein